MTGWKTVRTLEEDDTSTLIVVKLVPHPGITTVPTAEEARQLKQVSKPKC